jgi:hypothetical protein
VVINTTNGPVAVPRGTHEHVINTSKIVEEDMTYIDEEPEIISVLPAAGWHAVVGEDTVPLVAFVAMDSATMYGVAVGEYGHIDLTDSIEEAPGFSGYRTVTNNR